jgi:hypothetical protein
MIEFLSQFLGFFTRPFIDVSMSLAKQLESISTFAHIFVILWLEHKTTCLTSQLYADCQAMTKNIFFMVTRLQLIDLDHKFYLIHEGSDHLENLFLTVQTMDHG